MRKNIVAIALMFFGVCVLISSFVISSALQEIAFNQHLASDSINVHQNQWELIAVDRSHIILINHYTGEYITKFLTDENWTPEGQNFTMP